jgi:hypothetical protein
MEPGSFISKGNFIFYFPPYPLYPVGRRESVLGGGGGEGGGGEGGGLKALPIPDCFGEHSLLGLNWCAPDS